MNGRNIVTQDSRWTGVRELARRGRYRTLQAAIVLGVLTASLGAAPMAQAADCTPGSHPYPPSQCSLSLSATVVPEGGSLTVSGTGFLPGTEADLEIFSRHIHLADVTVDPQGNASVQITLPPEVEDGTHTLEMDGKNSDKTRRQLQATITVVEDNHAAPPQQGQGNGGSLAATGLDVTWLEALAGVTLGAGLLTVLTVRRRQRRTHAR